MNNNRPACAEVMVQKQTDTGLVDYKIVQGHIYSHLCMQEDTRRALQNVCKFFIQEYSSELGNPEKKYSLSGSRTEI